MTIRIFIGFDQREAVGFHVLAHSLMARSSMPIEITPIYRGNLTGIFERERGPNESTDFSISRFMVPCLSDYQGWSIFMDSDMLCLGDIAELARFMTLDFRWTKAVHVVKHQEIVKEESIKFLGEKQLPYFRKNWSSVMLFNNQLCRNLTPEYVSLAPGLDLHQFMWTTKDKIGGLPPAWNHLVGVEPENPKAKLVHYTLGLPCFRGYQDCEYSGEWFKELGDMTHYETKTNSEGEAGRSGEAKGNTEASTNRGLGQNTTDLSEVRVLRARAEIPYGGMQR